MKLSKKSLWQSDVKRVLIVFPVETRRGILDSGSLRYAAQIYPDLRRDIGTEPDGFRVIYHTDSLGIGVYQPNNLKKSIDELRQFALANPELSIRIPLPIYHSRHIPKNIDEIMDLISALPDNVIVTTRIANL